MPNTKKHLFGGKTLEAWDQQWTAVAGGLRHPQRQLRHLFGLYRLWLGDQLVALGSGTDRMEGIAKRLNDFRRLNASGRDHHAGRLIYERRHELRVEVLITGSDGAAMELARALRSPMRKRHKPHWNVPEAG